MSEDNTEKVWAHQFLSKPKTVAAGGLTGAVSLLEAQGDALVKGWVWNPQTTLFFFRIKHTKLVIVMVNIGKKISAIILLYLHFLQLFHLAYEIGNKKSNSSYLCTSNKQYLRAYLKSLNWDTREALERCKLRIWEFLFVNWIN